jgi:hypothetical protein
MKNLLLLLILVGCVGCGDSGPDPKVETNRVEAATKIRTLFDQTGGDYTKLSATDKADLLKLFNNNEAEAQKSWNFMKDRGGQGTAPGTPGMPGGTPAGG